MKFLFFQINHPSLKNEFIDVADENCKIDLNKPTVANAGKWKAEVGVKGKIDEIPAIVDVNVSRRFFFFRSDNSVIIKFYRFF